MKLKSLISRFDRWMAAITFAEAGEREAAVEFLYHKQENNEKKRIGSRLNKEKKPRPDIRL